MCTARQVEDTVEREIIGKPPICVHCLSWNSLFDECFGAGSFVRLSAHSMDKYR